MYTNIYIQYICVYVDKTLILFHIYIFHVCSLQLHLYLFAFKKKNHLTAKKYIAVKIQIAFAHSMVENSIESFNLGEKYLRTLLYSPR